MEIIRLSKGGVSPKDAVLTSGNYGSPFYALIHGEEGRGRWAYRIPLGGKDFPSNPDSPTTLPLLKKNYILRKVEGKQDKAGNDLYLVGVNPAFAEDASSKEFLVFLELDPGFRGGASYEVTGHAKVIGEGAEAQGTAGYMGGAPCPVVHVQGDATLRWTRTGRLYGQPAEWVATFMDGRITVQTEDEYTLSTIASAA